MYKKGLLTIFLVILLSHIVISAEGDLTETKIKNYNSNLKLGVEVKLPDGTKVKGENAKINPDASIRCDSGCTINDQEISSIKGHKKSGDTWSALK